MTPDIRLGRWEDVLADVGQVDCVMVDPPYSARVHAGHNEGVRTARHATEVARGRAGWPRRGQSADPIRAPKRRVKANGVTDTPVGSRREIAYSSWTPADVDAFVDAWAPRNRGWFVCLSDSELCPAYRSAFERHGLTGFQPLPVLIPGMTVRMAGDGPSSWAFYVNVARPKRLCKWGTLPGGYYGAIGSRERAAGAVAGAKPLWVMRALVRDYTRPGDLIVDPCAGGATTLIAAEIEGRRSVGAEVDAATFEIGRRRLAHEPLERRDEETRPSEHQPGLFG